MVFYFLGNGTRSGDGDGDRERNVEGNRGGGARGGGKMYGFRAERMALGFVVLDLEYTVVLPWPARLMFRLFCVSRFPEQ